MGACECDNPIEFGYELNSSEKETTIPKKIIDIENNLLKENFIQNEEIEVQKTEGVNALKSYLEKQKENKDKNIDNNNTNNLYFTTTSDKPGDEFSEYIFDNINKIRENPQSFIEEIEQSKKILF